MTTKKVRLYDVTRKDTTDAVTTSRYVGHCRVRLDENGDPRTTDMFQYMLERHPAFMEGRSIRLRAGQYEHFVDQVPVVEGAYMELQFGDTAFEFLPSKTTFEVA